jgi:hypothetical protein
MRQEMVVLTEHTCLDAGQIEKYLLRRLNEPEIAVVEERLLDCERCQEIFSGVEAYVCGMRRAMGKAQEQSRQLSVRSKEAAG